MFDQKTKILFTKILFTFQATYLEPKSIQILCLATIVIATETLYNGRQVEFNPVYIAS